MKGHFHGKGRYMYFVLQVKCVVEARDKAHSEELEAALRKRYDQVAWLPKYF